MKKVVSLVLTLAMVLSVSVTAAFADGVNSRGNKKDETKTASLTQEDANTADGEDTDDATAADGDETSESQDETSDQESADTQEQDSKGQDKKETNNQKQFKAELNEQKKELQQQKSALNQELEELQAQYEALVAAGDTAGAEALLDSINSVGEEIAQLQAQIKQTINERYMVVKTMYSEEELAQFEDAAALIAQMYEDANVLQAGCVTVNNNMIKFDAPAYIKGGVTLVPVRAITEQLGAEVSWDEETQTVTISKGDTVIEITAGSTTVLVNGSPVELSAAAEINCGRTFIPLRFLAETLGLEVTWDGENEIIDIDDPDAETTDDTATDASDETATDASDETTDDTATDTTDGQAADSADETTEATDSTDSSENQSAADDAGDSTAEETAEDSTGI